MPRLSLVTREQNFRELYPSAAFHQVSANGVQKLEDIELLHSANYAQKTYIVYYHLLEPFGDSWCGFVDGRRQLPHTMMLLDKWVLNGSRPLEHPFAIAREHNGHIHHVAQKPHHLFF